MTPPGQTKPSCADRPQTRCELWRDSVSQLPGAYVPQCDSQGQFLPTQCRQSTGQCWCVTPAGEVVPGTLTPQGQPRPTCTGSTLPGHPLTMCEWWRAGVAHLPGAFQPQCDSQGQFLPIQCWEATGQCWCINRAEEVVPGTLTAQGQPKPSCTGPAQTSCERLRDSASQVPGAYVPQCDSEGRFLPTQCRPTGQCWCVNAAGDEVPGTRTSPGQPRPVCPVRPLTRCELWRASVSHLPGAYVPQCDSQGQFFPTQCQVSTGLCWCVTPAGDVVPGTVTSQGQPRTTCTGVVPFYPTLPTPTDPPLTLCEQRRASVTVPGAYVPQCDSQGQFVPTQCQVSTGICWCVTPAGDVVPGTVTSQGQPRPTCTGSTLPGHPLTMCEWWRAGVAHLPGSFQPQCDSQGQFLPIQCWEATGQCWCINRAEEVVPGTLTAQGQPKPSCTGPAQTKCERLRDSASQVFGAYVPQCDSEGRFLPTQCRPTGQCWCVNAAGDEVPGTRTSPGQPRPVCPVRPLTRCELWRASVSHLPGAYVPQCDSQGQFFPTQCQVSTGLCWCVTPAGDVVPGTVTSQGQPRTTCTGVVPFYPTLPTPTDPPLTLCEQRRASVTVPGAYVPQCDSQGQFVPTQCQVSTGICWCVTPAGDVVPGTVTSQGQPRPTCTGSTLPGHPLTMCEWWRAGVAHLPGAFQPQCDSQGQFLPIQCWEATGQCWCINRAEEVVPGTLTAQGQPKPSCTGPAQTSCERLRDSASQVPGAYVPQCDSEGRFLPTQCRPTGQCWCVNAAGDEVPGTRTSPGQPRPVCPVRPLTRCELWRASVSHLPGAYVPQCDSQGQFFPTQCQVSTGLCWCVTPAGDVVPGTVTSQGQPRTTCTGVVPFYPTLPTPTDPPLTLCEQRRASVTVPGAYVPQCDSQGQFVPTQCQVSTGICWCVTPAGDVVPGTVTSQGQPRPTCTGSTLPGHPLTMCEWWRAGVAHLPGSFQPQCDSQGQFLPIQCWEATGQCWCINRAEEVVPGTLTAQGQPKPSCTGPAQTKCERLRDSASQVFGAYVPQCDSEGRFLPTQCRPTGQCWCVNAAGDEVPGTRTSPGQPRPVCPVRPLTRCELWRASVSHLPGAYIPQCDSQGQFFPTQCWVSTGQCWCVTLDGEVVPGTVTPVGQERHSCRDRPQTLCEERRSAAGTAPGAYVPQCDSQGRFLPTQCSDSTGYCWCVNAAGETVPGTLTPPGQTKPNCAVRPQTRCEQWRASVTPVPGAYVPQCDTQGRFLTTQCWGATGQCWCVNYNGDIISGTLTSSGQPRPSCPVCPLTQCQRDASVANLPGAYVPQCDFLGQFLPTQCWSATGQCWCVTRVGVEVQGTRRSKEQSRPACL
ncbi:thyroglobulin-like [Hypomesus transpacificus]|uniref:thyroglobulin-like n=1 Tax=Hypomesus transpacificus TaxID=137520 RepID=UPI001F08723A|nr:thyroglobulin-like [Hypomesus transpacificus]